MINFTLFPTVIVVFSLIIEGLSFPFSREISYHIVLLTSLVALITLLIQKQKKIELPQKVFVSMIGFVIFSAFSVFYAKHIPIAFEYFVWYLSIIFLFIYSFNIKKAVIPAYIGVVAALGIFCFYTLNFYSRGIVYLWHIPETGFNFFYPFHEDHNHLSDLLAFLYVGVLYLLLHYKKRRVLTGLFLCVLTAAIFITKSRTAIAVTILLTLIMSVQIYWNKIVFLINKFRYLLLGLCAFCVFAIVWTKPTPEFVWTTLNGRDNLFYQAFLSLQHYPIWGVGPGNFFVSSIQFGWEPFQWSYMSTNIFLDVLSENGLLAGISFISFVFLCLKNTKRSLGFYLIIALLISFQTDYLYRFYSVAALSFILLGNNLKNHDQKTISLPSWLLILGFVFIFIMQQAKLLGSIATKRHLYQLSTKLYPLQETSYEQLIENKIRQNNYQKASYLIKIYGRIFNGSAHHLKKIGDYYMQMNKQKLALGFYEKAYTYHPFEKVGLYKSIYTLRKKYYGVKSAELFLKRHFKKIEKIPNRYSAKDLLYNDVKEFCSKHTCPSFSNIY